MNKLKTIMAILVFVTLYGSGMYIFSTELKKGSVLRTQRERMAFVKDSMSVEYYKYVMDESNDTLDLK